MALSGLHVACGRAGDPVKPNSSAAIVGPAVWSETLATAATTANSAPPADYTFGSPAFSVRSSADAWIATGPTPNATSGPRRYIAANTDYDMFVNGGDKLAWIAA